MKRKLTTESIREALGAPELRLPKYASPLINLANQYAQGTRPKVVGQMTEYFRDFKGKALPEWEKYYKSQRPDAIERAADLIWEKLETLKDVAGKIDKEMVREWAVDLVVVKTFVGLGFHAAILREIAQLKSAEWKLATPEDESRGIDGYIGETPVSIKPSSYKAKGALSERIPCMVIYYEKVKDGIEIEFEDAL